MRRTIIVTLLAASCAACSTGPHRGEVRPDACVPEGAWVSPATGLAMPAAEILDRAAEAPVVLLGERHDSAADHRWQLDTLKALHARHPDMAIGIEMLPRAAQPALDRWVAGAIDEAAFLDESRWREAWGFDPELYLPILRFARTERVPLLALNVDRALVRRVGREGWAAIPPGERAGIGDPAPALPAYRAFLARTLADHGRPDGVPPSPERLERFIDAQLLWDRAMAEALVAGAGGGRPVAGLMGAGHVEDGFGVPRQIAALGVAGTVSLVPWEAGRSCTELEPGLADAVYGVAGRTTPE